MKSRVESEISDRQVLLNDNTKEPFLGHTKFEYELNKSKENKPRIIVSALSGFWEFFSLLSTWSAVIAPVTAAAGGSGLLNALYITLGISGAVGATATIVGGVVPGVIALVRLTVKMGMEIWNHRSEFKAITENPEYNGLQKFGLSLLVGLKCFGLALAKTIFTDFLVSKFTYMLAVSPEIYISTPEPVFLP